MQRSIDSLPSALTTLGLALGVLACGGGEHAPAERAGGPDVILISIDTLRADHVGLYGYERDTTPNIDRWFGSGAVYQRAYAAEASTAPSIVSILSGRLPQDHGVRLFHQLLPEDVELIPDLLPPQYQSAAIVSNMVLTDESMGMASRFDHYDDYVDDLESTRSVFERNAQRTTDAALAWLENERDPERPVFLWVHYIDPHGPYRPPADWTIPFEPADPHPIRIHRVPKYVREPGLSDGNEYIRRYDGEIAYVDAHIGRLLDSYSRLYPIDEALIVLTSDHGESMMEHEKWFTHGYHVYEEIVRVPLCLRGLGVEPSRSAIPVSGIDVASTILTFVGVDLPPLLPAVDLRSPSSLSPDRVVYSEAGGAGGQWRAAIRKTDKWMVAVEGPERAIMVRRAYDLAADPLELSFRAPGESAPTLPPELLGLVMSDPDPAGVPDEFRAGLRLKAPKVSPNATAEQLRRLRGLGYSD